MPNGYKDPNPGGFGSASSPDLSNAWKKARYEDYKAGRGEFAGMAGGGGGAGSPVDIAKQMYEMSSQFRQPAIETLQARQPGIAEAYGGLRTAAEAEKQPLEQRYQSLLQDITSQTRKAVGTTFTSRGLPTWGGMYESAVEQRAKPEIERVGLAKETGLRDINQLIANLGMQEQGQYDLLANAVSAIQAGASPEAISAAQGIYGQQQQAQQEAARLALAKLTQEQTAKYQQAQIEATKSPYLTLSEGQALYDPDTLQQLVKVAKTYKPSETVSGGLEDLYSQVFG